MSAPEQLSTSTTQWINDLGSNGVVALQKSGGDWFAVESLYPWNAAVVPEGAGDAHLRIASTRNQNRRPVRRCEVIYIGAWPAPEPAINTVRNVVANFRPRCVRFQVFLTDECSNLVTGLQDLGTAVRRCTVNLIGAIPELTEDEIEGLLRFGTRVTYAVGWPKGRQVNIDAIRRMSEIGLRIPVLFFVHRENIDTAIDDASQLLDVTYHAGVGFEPLCSHPLFNLDFYDLLPSGAHYAQFLTNAYRRFTHYDDVFEPIASLVDRLRNGGWCPVENDQLPIRYLVREDGSLHEFRQLPLEARPVVAVQPTAARSASIKDTCISCRWRPICGGCDNSSLAVFDLVCYYRMLFLEFFVREMHENLTDSYERQE